MAILKIARMGQSVLRRAAAPVPDLAAPELGRLIADMGETMRDAPGVGLAAPQVFSDLRLIVFRAPADRKDDGTEDTPDTALINPMITPLSDDVALGWEGCLSVPGLRGLVPRWRRIGYSGFLPDGTFIEREASGFLARVIQHECDHLDGLLYIDRMHDLRLLVCEDEMDGFRYEDYLDSDDSNDAG